MSVEFKFKVKAGKDLGDGFEVEFVSADRPSIVQRLGLWVLGLSTLGVFAAVSYGWLTGDFSVLKGIAETFRAGIGVAIKVAAASGK